MLFESLLENKTIATRHIMLCHSILALGQMSGDNPVLPAGRYQYPFQFQLPSSLPSSFEGAHGNVRHYLKATIDKPWKFDHSTKRQITIISIVDLNQMPNAAVSSIITS